MATHTAYFDDTGVYNDGWTGVGGANWRADTITNDGDTTYAWADADYAAYLHMNVDNLPAGSISVSAVTHTNVARKTGAGTSNIQMYWNDGTYHYSTNDTNTTSYVSHTQTPSAPTGGWTVANFNSTKFGFRSQQGTTGIDTRVTQHYITVTYTPGGGCIIRAFSHLLPLLGTITSLADIANFLNYAHAKIGDAIPVYTMDELRMIERKLRRMNRGFTLLREAA